MYSQRVSGGITRPGMVRVQYVANPNPTPPRYLHQVGVPCNKTGQAIIVSLFHLGSRGAGVGTDCQDSQQVHPCMLGRDFPVAHC